MNRASGSATRRDTGAYQGFGDVFIELGKPANAATAYRRELDIGRAVHTVTYTQDGVNYRREYFASHPAKVMVLRFTADKPGAYTGSVRLDGPAQGQDRGRRQPPDLHRFAGRLQV